MQGSLQDQVFGWAMANNNLANGSLVAEQHFATVWEFDLVEVPNHFDSVGAYGTNPKGKAPKVYELRMLNRVDTVDSGQRDEKGYKLNHRVTRETSSSTNKIKGFYCPWSGDRVWSVDLDKRGDFLFTATLNGCSVQAESGVDPKFSHANYLNGATQQIDQTAIDTNLGNRHAATDAKLQKTDYTNVAKKARRLARGNVLDYLATVIGFRDKKHNTWSFYYQSYKKFQTAHATNPSVTLNNVVLRDRAVRL
jgi:hypothetical protein